MAKPITKFAYRVKNENEIRFALEKAYHISQNKKGPVLIDIPMDLQKKIYRKKSKIYSKRKQAKKFSKKINFKNDCKIKNLKDHVWFWVED